MLLFFLQLVSFVTINNDGFSFCTGCNCDGCCSFFVELSDDDDLEQYNKTIECREIARRAEEAKVRVERDLANANAQTEEVARREAEARNREEEGRQREVEAREREAQVNLAAVQTRLDPARQGAE